MNFLAIKNQLFVLLLIISVFSCQTNRVYYASKSDKKSNQSHQLNPAFNLFLIGDAGAPGHPKGAMALEYLQKIMQNPSVNQPEKIAVVFLGDNIYPKGMPNLNTPERKSAEDAIKPSLAVAQACLGRKIFIPGNHDWYNELQNEADYIRAQNAAFEFIPEGNCPGPIVAIRNPNFSMVIIDTQWFLNNAILGRNSCAKSDSTFWKDLTDTLNAYQDKPIILLGHHPLVSNGPHGGHYHWTEHLFPLTQINHNLYVPLPIIGTILCLTRKWFGHNTDLSHPRYAEFHRKMIQLLGNYPRIHYVAGHDHSLQFHQITPEKFGIKYPISHTISGSGSKSTYVSRRNRASFVASRHGFVQIYFHDKKTTILFHEAESESVLYSTSF